MSRYVFVRPGPRHGWFYARVVGASAHPRGLFVRNENGERTFVARRSWLDAWFLVRP